MLKADRELDDQAKSCIYISADDQTDDDVPLMQSHPYDWRDLPDGYELRMDAYREAWRKCLGRMQFIMQALYASVAAQVVAQVNSSYADAIPGLPYPELPVIAMSAEAGSSSLYAEVIGQLERSGTRSHDLAQEPDDLSDAFFSKDGALVTHLYPADCPSLMTMMRAIISGLIGRSSDSDVGPKRRPAASLANYDINLLNAWYDASGSTDHLIVFLHDFEQFDPTVVQDVFHICSGHIPRLPLVFILALSSPPIPSYLHSAYKRSTLALLRLRMFTAPSGTAVVEEVINKTFLDPSFEPHVMLGPSALDFLAEFVTRHTASLDALLTIVQLVYMKHFTEPLTILTHSSLLGAPNETLADQKLAQPDSQGFFDTLEVRLRSSLDPTVPASHEHDPTTLLAKVDALRATFLTKVRRLRVGLSVARIVRQITQDRRGEAKNEGEANELKFVSAVLRGRATRDVRQLILIIKKLSVEKLNSLLQELLAFFNSLDIPDIRRDEEDARVRVENTLSQLPALHAEDSFEAPDELLELGASRRDPAVVQLAEAFGEWLLEYLEDRFARLDEGPLWDVWYTGSTPFPAELINPAPRVAVVSALAHPYEFVSAYSRLLPADEPSDLPGPAGLGDQDEREDAARAPQLWELPDTSILFRRSLEAGRMINVYDWFQSFAAVLDSQRRYLRRSEQRTAGKGQDEPVAEVSPKRRDKGKSRERAVMQMEVDGEDQGNEEDDEMQDEDDEDEESAQAWKMEVQARFIRALHELDYMGIVKSTGRKADHVVRTVYDVLY